MIFRYPEMEAEYHAAPVPLQVVFREFENMALEHGIEPIIYRILPGQISPECKLKLRLEVQCSPFIYSEKMLKEMIEDFSKKYGKSLIVIYRKRHDKLPERLIFEIPQSWAEQPRVFLAKFGYIKGGYHS